MPSQKLRTSTPRAKRLKEFDVREKAADTHSARAKVRLERIQFEQRIRGEKVTGKQPTRKKRGF